MKKILLTAMVIFFVANSFSQLCPGANQLVIRGAKNSGQFYQLGMWNSAPHASDPSQTEIIAEAWTCNGIGIPICNFRATIKYNLNSIPRNALVLSAKLYLYARTNSTNAYVGHPTYSNGGGNAVSIQRVTNDWDTTGVNYGWDDQTVTPQDSVVLPSSTNDAQDYVANLQNLVQFWVNNPDSNFGMQLKQINETYYKSMIFHSGTSPAAQQPRLEICYITEENFPKVTGTTYYDINGNGIKDSTEMIAPFVKVQLSNGNATFSDANGYYEIGTPVFGNYNVTVAAPNFYTASNLTSNYTFNAFGQTFANDIGFTATSNTDSINVKIIPFHHWARLGWSYPLYVEYENLGNTNLTPNAALYFDSSKLNYDSCNNATVTYLGNQLVGSFTTLKPGERHNFLTYLYTKPTCPIGDTTQLIASINAGTTMSFDEVDPIFTAAYDPNDIIATPELAVADVVQGKKYIDYTIHFQNLGNDTAFNIIVKSVLNNFLESNTLQVVATSHLCKASVVDNKLTFTFSNIKLPYKSINELKSMGFIKFRIKPKSTVIVGTTIPAKASIYFDYNDPVITNTATTEIKTTVLPLKFISYNLYALGNKIVNNFTTANEVNVLQYNIQRSINGKDFETIGTINATNKLNNEYSYNDDSYSKLHKTIYYRIVAQDKDGKISYSEIKLITPQQLNSNIVIYPNPTKNNINIETSIKLNQISLVDYLGRRIKIFNNIEGKMTVNTNDLPQGIYFIKLTTSQNEIITKKIIIE